MGFCFKLSIFSETIVGSLYSTSCPYPNRENHIRYNSKLNFLCLSKKKQWRENGKSLIKFCYHFVCKEERKVIQAKTGENST